MREIIFSLFFKTLYFLKSQIIKIVLFILIFPFFLILLTPYKSIIPWLKDQIYAKTQGQLQINYQDIKSSFIPPSLVLKNFKTDYKSQNIQSGDLKFKVNLLSLLKLSPSGTLELDDFLSSSLKLKLAYGLMPFFSMNLKDLKLELLSQMIEQIYGISGKLSLKMQVSGWFYDVLEKGFIQIEGKDIDIPELSIDSDLGPIKLSSLSFSKVKLLSEFKEKKLQISSFYLGEKKDPIYIDIKGFLDIQKQITNPIKSYQLQVKIEANYEDLDSSTQNYLSLLDKYRKNEGLKSVFSFLIESSSLNKPPSLKAL